MADQSGKVGEIYIEAKVIPRVDEAGLRSARDTIQGAVSGGGGGSRISAGQRAVDRAERYAMRQDARRNQELWGDEYQPRISDLYPAVRDANRQGAAMAAADAKQAAMQSRTLGQRAYALGQTDIMGTGMLMQFMFGGWEVASAVRNGMVGSMATTGMSPVKALGAQTQLVQQLQSGPLGSLAGQMVDPLSLRTASLQAAAQTATLAQTNEQAMVGLFETARLAGSAVRAAGGRGSAGQITSLRVAQEKSLSELRMNRQAMMRSIGDEAQARSAEIAATEQAGYINSIFVGIGEQNDEAFSRGVSGVWRMMRGRDRPDTTAADRVRRLQEKAAAAQFGSLEAAVVQETEREIRAIREDNSRQYQASVNERLLTLNAENTSSGLSMRRSNTISQQGIFALERETIAKDTAMRSYTAMNNTPLMFSGMMYEVASAQFGGASRMAGVDRAERDYNTSMAHQNTNFIAERQRAMMQTARETFGYQSVGRQLDFLLDRGNPFSQTNAQAQGIVDNALLAAGQAKNSQQRDLVLENARKELELLQRPNINPVSGGTPSLFVGGGAPIFNAGPFQQQLQNPQLPGANPPSATQVQQIIDLLQDFIR